jgi:hypothetical protein
MLGAKLFHHLTDRSMTSCCDVRKSLTNGLVNFGLFFRRRMLNPPQITKLLQRLGALGLNPLLSEAMEVVELVERDGHFGIFAVVLFKVNFGAEIRDRSHAAA